MNNSRSSYHRGFTLVEILIVIVIIGLLAAILIPILRAAINNAKRARMALEISQLESAIDAYKTQNGGEYPPDLSDDTSLATTNPARAGNRVSTHLRRAFPRMTLTINTTTWSGAGGLYRPGTYFGVTNPTFASLDPAEALVFWLSQLANNPQNPLNPVDSSGAMAGQPKVYFNFDQARFQDKDGDGWPEYYPKDSDVSPYVYFEFHTYASAAAYYPYVANAAQGVARPYCTAKNSSGVPTAWANASKFQIICAGLDGDYGADTLMVSSSTITGQKLFPTGDFYQYGDRDNLTNFSEGKTLENNKP